MTQNSNPKGEAKMLMAGETGNMAQVRDALQGITGQTIEAEAGPEREYGMVIARPNREYDLVDSYRRLKVPAYWPSYETLVKSNRQMNGQPVRRMLRVGVIPGYVFCPTDARDHTGKKDFEDLLESVVGAIDIARNTSGKRLLLKDADIKIIRKIDVGLNTPDPAKAVHHFKVGEKVRFTDDLIGRWPPGKVKKLVREGRIKVEVDLMGRKVEITVYPHQIERM